MRAPRTAVFLDRDGVINYNRDDYVKRWAEFRFLPGALTALKQLAAGAFPIIVITNQSAVGRGLLDPADLEYIHRQMTDTIFAHGGRIDHIFYCPHHPEAGCDCRKPKPGLLKQAANLLGVDLTRSYLVGDALSDIQAGLAVGCQPLLVLTGRGATAKQAVVDHYNEQCEVTPNLSTAVVSILRKTDPNSNQIQTFLC